MLVPPGLASMAAQQPVSSNLVRFGRDYELDRGAYELRKDGRRLRLARIPMDLLLLLLEQPGQLVTREQIAERLWGKDVFLDIDNGINAVIRRIRQVLEDDPEKPRFVETVIGRGYRFIGPVELVAAAAAVAPTVPSSSTDSHQRLEPVEAPAARGSETANKAPSPVSAPGHSSRILVLTAVAVAFVVTAVFGALRLSRSSKGVDSIAVLPF